VKDYKATRKQLRGIRRPRPGAARRLGVFLEALSSGVVSKRHRRVDDLLIGTLWRAADRAAQGTLIAAAPELSVRLRAPDGRGRSPRFTSRVRPAAGGVRDLAGPLLSDLLRELHVAAGGQC